MALMWSVTKTQKIITKKESKIKKIQDMKN